MITFTRDCMIGIEEIDSEHQRLFDLINHGTDLLERSGMVDNYDEIKDFVVELEDYAELHFMHEEEYMQKIKDPELISQRVQHNAFRNRVNHWAFSDIDDVRRQREVILDMISFMTKWLFHHIMCSDMMIGKMPPIEEWKLRENPYEFKEEYCVGVTLIDEEHRELFRIIQQVDGLVRMGVTDGDFVEIQEIMERLKNYTKEHFADEEEYMQSIGYERLTAQKYAHEAFIEKIEQLDYEAIKKNAQDGMEQLIEFLTQWLINHIVHMDKQIPS